MHEAQPEKIVCRTVHSGKTVDIRRGDMATLYSLWDRFLQGDITRLEIAERLPRTQYAISLMKYLKEKIS